MKATFVTAAWVLSFTVLGCSNTELRKVCTAAADRYEVCVGETLGASAKRMVAGKRDIDACVASERTAHWYRDKCLKTDDCEAFMACTMELAMQKP